MKRIVSALLAVAVLAALAIIITISKRTVRPVYAQSGCSVATLNGNYGSTQAGFSTKNRGNLSPFPAAIVGVVRLDGAGNFSGTFTDMDRPYNGPFQANSSGTYSVNSDCTGSFSFTAGDFAGITGNIVIVDGGTEIFGIITNPGVITTYDQKKQ